jgi:hypothetical protein
LHHGDVNTHTMVASNWLQLPPTPADLVARCSVSCSGFSALRPECVANACISGNLCTLVDPAATAGGRTCAEWCCVPHSWASLILITCAVAALLALVAGCVYARRHRVEERELEERAMAETLDQSTSGPSSTLKRARDRLANFVGVAGDAAPAAGSRSAA